MLSKYHLDDVMFIYGPKVYKLVFTCAARLVHDGRGKGSASEGSILVN